MGIAKTGSGKTASYALPILNELQKAAIPKNRHVDVLVLVPTRELAVQVKDVFQQFGSGLPERMKTLAVYGGVSINPQMQALNNVNVLVATPGRLLDLVDSKAVHLSEVKTLVLDEAEDRKSTRLNSSHKPMSYAVCCLKKKIIKIRSEEHTLELQSLP